MSCGIDYARHNEEVKQVWDAYNAGKPIRVPMILGIASRFYMLNPELNTEGITYKQYYDSPEVKFDVQCKLWDYVRHNVPFDVEMGVPEENWVIGVDFENVWDQASFGCEIHFLDNQSPVTMPRYDDDKSKYELIARDYPDPFGGYMAVVKEAVDYFREKVKTFEYKGRPIELFYPPLNTDGLFTLACELRGANKLLMDMVCDSEYYHKVMDFVTEAATRRIKAWRKYLDVPEKGEMGFFADDFIQMISVEHYKEFVLPYHKRFLAAFSGGSERKMHICGDVQRHFPTLIKELGVTGFDTGFPIDFTTLRDEIGENVEIAGGPHVELLLNGSQDDVCKRSIEILQSGIMRGGKFIIRDGNNVAPGTPIENISAMYEACKEYGRY